MNSKEIKNIGIAPILIIIVLLAGIISLILYLKSYTYIEFTYNSDIGYILLSDKDNTYKPKSGEKIRLKKGDYKLSNRGNHVDENKRTIHIDGSLDKKHIDFKYTDKYLLKLYNKQKLDIYTSLLLEYPSIEKGYSIEKGKLYSRGQIFGATLIYKNKKSNNRDSLHVLMEKKSGKWIILSKPPEPVLSKPQYEDIPMSILKKINLSV